jgi:hypothetical protein
MEKEKNKISYTARLNRDTVSRFCRVADAAGCTRSEVIQAALDLGLDQIDKMLALVSLPVKAPVIGLLAGHWRKTVGAMTMDDIFRHVLDVDLEGINEDESQQSQKQQKEDEEEDQIDECSNKDGD